MFAKKEGPELDRIGRPKRADRQWHRYRPTWSLETLALHPRHVVLAALVAGLLTGPRAVAATIGLTAALIAAAVALRRRALFRRGAAEDVSAQDPKTPRPKA